MSDPVALRVASGHFFDPVLGSEAAKILPGEFKVTSDDIALVTVLGSCVAACLRDPRTGIGGMNHFMLPDAAPAGDAGVSGQARYGSYAMEMLINEMVKRGARRESLQAKVFGGAHVIAGMQMNIGQRNAKFVLDFLKTEGIPVLARDLEDNCPRKVAYFPHSGVAKVKRMPVSEHRTLLERERDYRRKLKEVEIAGGVELF